MSPVWAHGIQGRADLPVPLTAFYWAASVILVVSFVALWLGWRTPLLAGLVRSAGRPATTPRAVTAVLQAGAVLAYMLVLVAALTGSRDLNSNIAPVAIFVVWWIGIAVLAATVGDVWRSLHPIAAMARLARIPAVRRDWPASWGLWPAFGLLLLFTWLELVYPTAAHVRLLGVLVVAWSVVTLLGMVRYGVDTWLDHGEPFAVYTRVLSYMSVRHGGQWQLPVVGLTCMPTMPGAPAFVGLLIGSVSFDGLSRTLWWKGLVQQGSVQLVTVGIQPAVAQLLFGTIGLLTMVLVAIGTFRIAADLARVLGRLPQRTRWGNAAATFAPSLVPIAVAYVVAHYFSYFWFQGQELIRHVSDPFGSGRDIFGTASFAVDYSTLTPNVIWGVQVGAIVLGHVLGLALAHDRALQIEAESDGARPVRSQLPMLLLMVLYTVGGLYFLSEGLNV